MRVRGKRSALIVGMGRFGIAVGRRLTTLGWDVVGVDKDDEVVQDLRDQIGHVVQLDAADEDALGTVGVPDFDVCVVSHGTSIESSIMLVLNLQGLGARRIVAKAATEHHRRILERLNVKEVIFPERDAGIHLAEALQSPHLIQWINLPGERELGVVTVPEDRVGTTLRSWKELNRLPLQFVGRLTESGWRLDPDLESPLNRGDTVVVVGPLNNILALGE
jgi:trk system potassium uptake protein